MMYITREPGRLGDINVPKTKRDELKRRWAQAKNHLEQAAVFILDVQAEFEPVHPEYAELCDYVLTSIYMSMEGWDAFCLNAWGKLPKHTSDWRA
jgi:hypothetical protein